MMVCTGSVATVPAKYITETAEKCLDHFKNAREQAVFCKELPFIAKVLLLPVDLTTAGRPSPAQFCIKVYT